MPIDHAPTGLLVKPARWTESKFAYLWRNVVGCWAPCLSKSNVLLGDLSGLGSTGTVGNAPVRVPSPFGSALRFVTGSTNTVNLVDNGKLKTDSMTAFAVLKMNASQTARQIIGNVNGSSAFAGWALGISDSSALQIKWFTGTTNPAIFNHLDGTKPLVLNRWHAVCGTFVYATSGINKFNYLDGHITNSVAFNGSNIGHTSGLPGIGYFRSAGTEHISADIAMVVVFNRALTHQEVRALSIDPIGLLRSRPQIVGKRPYWSLILRDGSGTSTSGTTTSPRDTTNANLIVLHVSYHSGFAAPTISDLMNNTWTPLTLQTVPTGVASRLYYCANPITSPVHTFSALGTNSYAGLTVQAWRYAADSPFDQENGTATPVSPTVTTLSPGSVTPSEPNSLIVTGLSVATTTVPTIDSGFTISTSLALLGGTYFGSTLAYKVQSAAAAVNPAWSWSPTATAATEIATFKSAEPPVEFDPAQMPYFENQNPFAAIPNYVPIAY